MIVAEGQKLDANDIEGHETIDVENAELLSVLPLVEWEDRYFYVETGDPQCVGLPPGAWEIIGSFAAAQLDHYIYAAHTLGDSTAITVGDSIISIEIPYTAFAISAHSTTPSVWYMSPADSGYSVDNIAPGVPDSLSVTYNTGSGNYLTWAPCSDEDFQYYRIYRSFDSDPSLTQADSLAHLTILTEWYDSDYDGWNVYYTVTAIDHAGNESCPSTDSIPTAITGQIIPNKLALYQNVPNPFNPSTVIRFDIPAARTLVTLEIFDVSGQLIHTLINGEVASGRKSAIWNGKDSQGNPVSSGVYFYRLKAGSKVLTKKMVLLK
jgi:hypothetical protein